MSKKLHGEEVSLDEVYAELEMTPEEISASDANGLAELRRLSEMKPEPVETVTSTGNSVFDGWHLGDPCRWCGIPHDEVPVGPCLGPPSNQVAKQERGSGRK